MVSIQVLDVGSRRHQRGKWEEPSWKPCQRLRHLGELEPERPVDAPRDFWKGVGAFTVGGSLPRAKG